jgi:hypothetical protein
MDGFKKWHQPSRAVCTPISATKSANSRHPAKAMVTSGSVKTEGRCDNLD